MAYVKIIDVPDDKDLYIIGDVHGNYDFYEATLRELGITDDDVIISVGDLVDRGLNNSKMLNEFLKKENRYMVLGNHENMMIRGQTDSNWYLNWLRNGGQQTLDEIGAEGIAEFCTLIEETVPYILEVNHRGSKLGIAHAGIPHYQHISDWETIKHWTENNAEYRHQLIWDRDAIEYARHDYNVPEKEKLTRIITGVDYVIHGHTGVPNKFQFGNRVWIDTQFRSSKFTLAYIDSETNLMKFKSVVPDLWGGSHGYYIEEQ